MAGWKDRTSRSFVRRWRSTTNTRVQDVITSTLEAYGNPIGHSAMALTVGVPCGIASQLVLDGVINQIGVQRPYTKELCDPIRKVLEGEGIGMVEKVL